MPLQMSTQRLILLLVILGLSLTACYSDTGATPAPPEPPADTTGTLKLSVEDIFGVAELISAKVEVKGDKDSKLVEFLGPETKTLELATGDYTVTPQAVAGHVTPDAQSLTIKSDETTEATVRYSLEAGERLLGQDNDNPDNLFIQPADETDKQHMENTDTLFGGEEGDLLIGFLGRDNLLGEAGNDILVGGNEGFVAPNSDVIDGGPGDDINIWTPGDGSDAFLGGEGQDIMVFGPPAALDASDKLEIVDFKGRSIVQVDMDEKPQFSCQLEALDANSELGFDFLARFLVNGDVKVTVRLKDVEKVYCPSAQAGFAAEADLSEGTTFQDEPMSELDNTLLGAIFQ